MSSDAIYCTLCFVLIPEEDQEEGGQAFQSCNMDWFCCEDHYYDSKDEELE